MFRMKLIQLGASGAAPGMVPFSAFASSQVLKGPAPSLLLLSHGCRRHTLLLPGGTSFLPALFPTFVGQTLLALSRGSPSTGPASPGGMDPLCPQKLPFSPLC